MIRDMYDFSKMYLDDIFHTTKIERSIVVNETLYIGISPFDMYV